jgi:hypothetical protein
MMFPPSQILDHQISSSHIGHNFRGRCRGATPIAVRILRSPAWLINVDELVRCWPGGEMLARLQSVKIEV